MSSDFMTVEDMSSMVVDFKAELDEIKKDNAAATKKAETEEKEKKMMMIKKDAETKEKENPDPEAPEPKDKNARILQASEIEDPEKRKAAMKSAMTEDVDEKEKKELNASIDYLTKELAKPKITFLANSYQNTAISKEALSELETIWSAMTIPDLEKEITKITPLLEHQPSSSSSYDAQRTNQQIIAPSTTLQFSGSSSSNPQLESLTTRSDADLFNDEVGQ